MPLTDPPAASLIMFHARAPIVRYSFCRWCWSSIWPCVECNYFSV